MQQTSNIKFGIAIVGSTNVPIGSTYELQAFVGVRIVTVRYFTRATVGDRTTRGLHWPGRRIFLCFCPYRCLYLSFTLLKLLFVLALLYVYIDDILQSKIKYLFALCTIIEFAIQHLLTGASIDPSPFYRHSELFILYSLFFI